MAEFGVFNDEGCVDSGYRTLADAETSAATMREQGDEYAKASQICDEHEEQPADGCEICDACSNCGEPDCEGWCDDCDEYACDGCTCNDWNEE